MPHLVTTEMALRAAASPLALARRGFCTVTEKSARVPFEEKLNQSLGITEKLGADDPRRIPDYFAPWRWSGAQWAMYPAALGLFGYSCYSCYVKPFKAPLDYSKYPGFEAKK
jgi:hypothetical protein